MGEESENQSLVNSEDAPTNSLIEPLLQERSSKSNRIEFLDLFRGFIMIVMAWDHSKDILIDTTQEGKEGWQGEGAHWRNSYIFFLSRTISDICAPGFYFTMGLSLVLFTKSRLKKGMSLNSIIIHFIKRSLVLFIVGRFVNICFSIPKLFALIYGNSINSKTDPNNFFNLWDGLKVLNILTLGFFEVMTGLSLSLLFCCTVILPIYSKLQKNHISLILPISWFLFSLFILISNQTIVHYQYDDINNSSGKVPLEFPNPFISPDSFLQVLSRLILLPGALFNGEAYFTYPLLPWTSLTVLGMGFGFKEISFLQGNFFYLSFTFLLLFLIVRSFGGTLGNLRGWPRNDGDHEIKFLIEYLYTNKYPPSLAYILITMSVNFCLMGIFNKAELISNFPKTKNMLAVFGKVPLFYYMLHLFLIGTLVGLMGVLGGCYADNGNGLKLSNMALNIPFLVVILCILYPSCQYYHEYKKTLSKTSILRFI